MDPSWTAPIWIAGFTFLGACATGTFGIITIILQNRSAAADRRFAAEQRSVLMQQSNAVVAQGILADQKLDTIHTLTNSNMSKLEGKLDNANTRLEERAGAEKARLAASAAVAAPSGFVGPAPSHTSILSSGEASAAVAEAAVDKKDQIVGPKK